MEDRYIVITMEEYHRLVKAEHERDALKNAVQNGVPNCWICDTFWPDDQEAGNE